MNRRTFMKFLLGTVASIAVNPIDALSRPAQPMPIPRQPIPEPDPVEPIIEISNFGRSIEYDTCDYAGRLFHAIDPASGESVTAIRWYEDGEITYMEPSNEHVEPMRALVWNAHLDLNSMFVDDDGKPIKIFYAESK